MSAAPDTTLARMIATIGIIRADLRNRLQPEPSDDRLYLELTCRHDFTPVDVIRWFALAKQEATNA